MSPKLSPCCHPDVTLMSPCCHPADTLLPHSGLPAMKGEKIFFCCKVGCAYSLLGPSLHKQCYTDKSAFYGRHKDCAAGFCYVTLSAAQDKGCTLVQSKGGRPSTLRVPEGVQLSALATKVLDAQLVLLATRVTVSTEAYDQRRSTASSEREMTHRHVPIHHTTRDAMLLILKSAWLAVSRTLCRSVSCTCALQNSPSTLV